VLFQKEVLVPFLPFLPVLFYGCPFYFACLAQSECLPDFLYQRHNKFCHFILDIMDYFLLAETSNKPISLTTWLAVDPYLVM